MGVTVRQHTALHSAQQEDVWFAVLRGLAAAKPGIFLEISCAVVLACVDIALL
jgi:hypothetical protein